jgi:hypothetical protein
MKLRDIAQGTRAVKSVPLRLANAPLLEAGVDWEKADDGGTVIVGVRIVTGLETSEAIKKAQDVTAKAGVPQWLATHPLCQLHEMAEMVAIGCVDNEARDEPFFIGGSEEVLASASIGAENIAYLAEQIRNWQDEVSPRGADITPEVLMHAIVREAERPENAPEAFFSRLRPKERVSCIHSMAKLLSDLLTNRSLSSLVSTGSSSTTTASSSPSPEPPTSPPRRKGRK